MIGTGLGKIYFTASNYNKFWYKEGNQKQNNNSKMNLRKYYNIALMRFACTAMLKESRLIIFSFCFASCIHQCILSNIQPAKRADYPFCFIVIVVM